MTPPMTTTQITVFDDSLSPKTSQMSVEPTCRSSRVFTSSCVNGPLTRHNSWDSLPPRLLLMLVVLTARAELGRGRSDGVADGVADPVFADLVRDAGQPEDLVGAGVDPGE